MTRDADHCDVFIAGAGPAGSTAAYLLARRGWNVHLCDRTEFPRPKLCAGLLTWKTMDLLQAVFNASPGDLTAQGIICHTAHDYRIYRGPTELARGRLRYPFHFVNRLTYDQYWLEMARRAGARTSLGNGVARVDPEVGMVTLQNGRCIWAKAIIGADGIWSTVRRSILNKGWEHRYWRTQLAMTIETRRNLPKDAAPPRYAALHFGFVPWGYAWSFPQPRQQILGMACLTNKRHASISKRFREFLASLGISRHETAAWQGYPLPYGNYITSPGRGRVLLVGDACGLADPLLGEGIFYAHRSAVIAANAIITARRHLDNVAVRYSRDLNRNLLWELRWIKFYRNLLFIGGRRRRFRGLQLLLRLLPHRLEAAVHGHLPFKSLALPVSGR